MGEPVVDGIALGARVVGGERIEVGVGGDAEGRAEGAPRDPRTVATELFDAVGSAVRGAPDTVRLALVALLSGGHLLVEGMPGRKSHSPVAGL